MNTYIDAINHCKQSPNSPPSIVNPSSAILSPPLPYVPEPPPYQHLSPPNPYIKPSCLYHHCHNRPRKFKKQKKQQTGTTTTDTVPDNVPATIPMTDTHPDNPYVSDCNIKKSRCFVDVKYCKLSVVFMCVLFMCLSLLMFSGLDGEMYMLYARDNHVLLLIRNYIVLYARRVGMKIHNCRKSHYMMHILRLSGISRDIQVQTAGQLLNIQLL